MTKKKEQKRIGVLGAGTWGTALARLLTNKGQDVTIWSALPAEIEQLQTTKAHKNLPGMVVPDELKYTLDIGELCRDKDILLFVVASPYVRSTARSAAPFIPDGQLIVDAAKGIEADTMMSLTQVIEDEVRRSGNTARLRLAALSGPTHAEEVALDMPTTIVAASNDIRAAEELQDACMTDKFRVYVSGDIEGVEMCGALKNPIALATGISSGLGYGDNTKAALITRGLAEIMRLGSAMGSQPQTFSGLAGIGDMIVTATSIHSRNYCCGRLIGEGKKPEEAIKEVGMVVEGINVLPAAMEMAERYHVDLPIIGAVNDVIHNGLDPREAVDYLMDRAKKREH